MLPVTALVAIVLTNITLAAFYLNQTNVSFIFTTLTSVAWITLVAEFLFVYHALIDQWFIKDRSIVAAVWFVISIFFAIWIIPNKGIDWTTAVTSIGLFCILFFIPYALCIKYENAVARSILGYWEKIKSKIDKKSSKQIRATLNKPVIQSYTGQDNETEMYSSMIMALNPEFVKGLPQMLQSNDALFLLVLFREDGYLNQDFKPVIVKDRDEINQTLYAFIADAISMALKIKIGKWTTFEKFWLLNNAPQLVNNLNKTTKDHPTEHQRHIAKLFRKATRLRPKLETAGIQKLMKTY